MKASYRRGVDFIALYDEALELEAANMEGQPSILALAEVFDKPESEVIADVLKRRHKQLEWDAKDRGRAAQQAR